MQCFIEPFKCLTASRWSLVLIIFSMVYYGMNIRLCVLVDGETAGNDNNTMTIIMSLFLGITITVIDISIGMCTGHILNTERNNNFNINSRQNMDFRYTCCCRVCLFFIVILDDNSQLFCLGVQTKCICNLYVIGERNL